jgi:murein DD-endopeptidase MepM/ murein hydrolase activator NlpD
MKKIFLVILFLGLSLYLAASLYFMDRSYFLCPIEYKGGIVIRSDGRGDGTFGAERNGRRVHEGVDLYAQVGTPVRAARSGIVRSARRNLGMGNYVVLRHRGNLVTIYGHLKDISVKKNKFVRQGQIIGTVGKTGNANYRDIQPHLHLEVRKNRLPEDPMAYLD